MDTFIAYFNEKDNNLSVFNPYVNDKINYGTLNENTIYITWKRLQGNVHQIVLSEIADMDNIKTEDLWFYVNSQKHPLLATYKAYTLLKEQVKERQVLSQHFKTNLINMSDIKVADYLYRIMYGDRPKPISPERIIDLQSIIIPSLRRLPYCTKYSREYGMYDRDNHKNIEKEINGITLTMGAGGVHGAVKGIHECNDYETIYSFDFNNFYASIIINYGIHPRQLNKDKYIGMMKYLVEYRKTHNTPLAKMAITSLYGKLNKTESWIFDNRAALEVTINGQIILLSVLMDICDNVLGAIPLMVNTDGFEIRAGKDKESQITEIIENWSKTLNIGYKSTKYSKMIIYGVNDYIAVGEVQDGIGTEDDYRIRLGNIDRYAKVKYKGRYRICKDEITGIQCPNAMKMVSDFYLYGFRPGQYTNKYNKYTSPSRELSDDECIQLAKETIYKLQKPVDAQQLTLL